MKNSDKKNFRWGIIGPGNIAHDFANDLKLAGGTQKITAVLSHREESAKDFAKEFQIPEIFTNLNDFVQNSNVDIAYIATPHPLHYEEIKACLTHHIAVLCEKPIVLNHEQHDELQNLSIAKNTFLMEGMWIRFLPGIRKMLKLVETKKIGEIFKLKAAVHYNAPEDNKNRFYDPAKGGGSLLDLGIYSIFLSYLLLGKPDTIKATGRLTSKKIDEACAILLGYADGRYAMLESSLLINHNTPAEIYGTKGVIRIADPWFEKTPEIEIELNDGSKEDIPVSWEGHGFQFEIDEVIRCLSAGKVESDLLPGKISAEILKIMDEVRNQIGVHYPEHEHH